jgi:hypothetical protein
MQGLPLLLLLPAQNAAAGEHSGDSFLLLLLLLRGLGDLLMSDVSTRVHARPMLLAARFSPEACVPASGTTSDSAWSKEQQAAMQHALQ